MLVLFTHGQYITHFIPLNTYLLYSSIPEFTNSCLSVFGGALIGIPGYVQNSTRSRMDCMALHSTGLGEPTIDLSSISLYLCLVLFISLRCFVSLFCLSIRAL